MRMLRTLVLTGLILALSSLTTVPAPDAGSALLSMISTPALLAQGPACNQCHYCPGVDKRYISAEGASTIEITSEPTEGEPCENVCEDFVRS